jgi:hypothetical protein
MNHVRFIVQALWSTWHKPQRIAEHIIPKYTKSQHQRRAAIYSGRAGAGAGIALQRAEKVIADPHL